MLSPDQMRSIGEEADEEYADMEGELLNAAAESMGQFADGIELGAVAGAAIALLPIQKAIIDKHSAGISEAVRRDCYSAFVMNAATELSGLEPNALGILKEAREMAERTAPSVTASILGRSQAIANNANSAYYQALVQAANDTRAGLNSKNAVAKAVSDLAKQGVTYSTYTRGDGVVVKVPVDVGVRREIRTTLNAKLAEQTMSIAKEVDCNLVEVSSTATPRPSHAEWEGQVYQLEGSGEYQNFYKACLYGDPVDGFGGYNCYHTIALYRGYRHFKDPLEGTGYTKEEAYELSQKQRHLENLMRKDRREIDALKAGGFPTTEARARLKVHQTQYVKLVGSNEILTDQSWRARLWGEAGRQERKVIANAKAKPQSAPAPKMIYTDKNNQIYQGAGAAAYDAATELLGKANPTVSKVWARYERELKLVDGKKRGEGAYYSPYERGIHMNVKKDLANERGIGRLATWFHEFGHNIDYATGQGRRGVSYARGLGSKVKEEAQAYVKARHDAILAEWKAARRAYEAGDYRAAFAYIEKWKIGEAYDRKLAKEYVESNGKRWEYGQGEALAGLMEKPKKAAAYNSVNKELEEVWKEGGDGAVWAVSDMFAGATGNQAKYRWHHTKSYWDAAGENLGTEAFAEFFSAEVVYSEVPETLETMKRFFPESYDLFTDILEGIL